jgi:hypothetical protein
LPAVTEKPPRPEFKGLPASEAVLRFEILPKGGVLVEAHDLSISTVIDYNPGLDALFQGDTKVHARVRLDKTGNFQLICRVADRHW